MLLVLLSPTDVRNKGLKCLNSSSAAARQTTSAAANTEFHKHFGSSPLDLADMWYDLNTTDIPGAQLEEKDKSENGFKMFMAAHHFLWTYPKNAELLASRFGICERYSRGDPLWMWIKKIAALQAKKILWDNSLTKQPNNFLISVDGIDFRMWERKHPTLPVNTKDCSKKFNHGAVKYELACSIFHAKCVWINGPFRGGKHDMTVFREDGLKAKMLATAPGKIAIADRGYATSRPDEVAILATPNETDPEALGNFKRRVRCRHETFNGRIKFFKCLSDTFRHGLDKHKFALEAVCVTVQYQMDNGSEIFAV
jgi:DDE superfamily endonuclease